MKKFLHYILILVLTLGVFFPTHDLSAQLGIPSGGYTQPSAEERAEGGVTSWLMGGLANVFPSAKDLVSGIIVELTNPILIVMSWLLWLSGQLLNYTINYTIIDMRFNLEDLTGINTAWKVIRDLMNIAFIFMLIYEGIILIIGQGNAQQIKKFIMGIILASLLINFSLFFTKVMIDASNIVTIGFYKTILGDRADEVDFTEPITGTVFDYGLSNPIVEKLGLTSIYKSDAASIYTTGQGPDAAIIRTVGSGLIILIASFVFFAVSIMFVIRYVTLIILLMLSPIAYMGMALPFMGQYSKQWWSAFKSQLLFAPIYMVMTWVVLILMSSANFITRDSFTSLLNNIEKPPASSIGLLLNFAIIIGLLIASLIIAKDTASKGSKMIGQATGKLSAFAGGTVLGGGARISRNTIGRWGNAAANDENLKERAKTSRFARLQLAAADKASNSSFDARGSRAFGSIASAAGMKNDFGKVDSKKENFRAQMEERDKAETKRAERYKTSDLATLQAKQKLGSDEFKKDEENNKAKRETYLASDDYKNSIEYSDREKLKNSLEEISESERNLIAMKQAMENEEKGTREWFRMQENVAKSEKEIINKKKTQKTLQDVVGKYESDVINDTWMSNERKNLMAIAGGTTKDKKGVIRDANNNIVNAEVKSAYQQRMDAEASRIDSSSALWRITANTIGLATNAVGITAVPRTKTDRQRLAMKLKKQAGGKNAKDKIMDAVKEMADAERTEEETPKAPAAPEAPVAPAQEPEKTT